MNKIMAVLAVGTLALAACGDDDGGSSPAKSELLDQLTADGADEFFDEGCLEDKINDLDEEDAEFLVDNQEALDAGDVPEGSPQAVLEFSFGVLECTDFDMGDIDFGDIDLGDIDLGDLTE